MKKLLILALLLPVLLSADAGLREPTGAEKTAIEKMRHAVRDVFERFAGPDWGDNEDRTRQEIMVNPHSDRPLDINTDFHRGFATLHDSKRAMTVLAPYQKQVDDAMERKDMAAAVAAGEKMNPLIFVSMEAHINHVIVEAPPPSKPSDATIAGAAFAYKVPEQTCNWNDEAKGQCWLIAFGDWKGTWNPARHRYEFKFKHPNGTPYIENVVITLRGAPDRIQENFKLPVWAELDAALTR